MNKAGRFFFVLLCSVLFYSCSSLPKDDEQTWVYNSDKTLGILVQSDGLHFTKKISASYDSFIVHVDKIDGKTNAEDVSTVDIVFNRDAQEIVYPFTKKGQTYKIYISYKNKKSGKITKSSPVSVVASGGIGEYKVSASAKPSSYNSKEWKLTFSNFTKVQSIKPEKENITGNLIIKNEDSYWYNDFEIAKNTINLKPLLGKIRGKDFALVLDYSFEYEGQTYTQEFFNNELEPFSDTNGKGEIGKTGLKVVRLSTKSGKPVASRENWEKGSLNIDGKIYDLQVKGRGNSSWGTSPKHSYTLKLSKKTKLFDMDESKGWVLVSNYADKTLIRNQYVEYLGQNVFNRMMWNPHFEQVELYINDEYLGTYLFGQKIKLEKTRINIDKEGFLVEINRREDEDFNFRTTHDVSISLKEPDDISKSDQIRIRNIIQTAEDVLFSKDYKDPVKGYAAYFDLDSLIDWYIINEYSKNVDSAWFSSIYLFYDPKDGKLHFGPLWDYDLSFGNINYNDCDKTDGFYIQVRGVWFARLFTDPAFCKKVKDRWNQKKSAVYKSIETQINKLYENVKESGYYNFERWPILGEYVWPNADGYEKRLSVRSEIEYFKNWCYERYQWLDTEFNKY